MSGIKIVIIQDIVPSGMDYDSIQAHPAAQRVGAEDAYLVRSYMHNEPRPNGTQRLLTKK